MDVGIGKYHNRNVIDMFAGISRGKEQLRENHMLPIRFDRLEQDFMLTWSLGRDSSFL